jgi:signal transduction histidine kinase
MLLLELMSEHREEILQVCRKHLRDNVVASSALERDVGIFFDEILQTLRHHHGLTEARTFAFGKSETAARLGEQQQRAGLHPAKVPLIFGAISSAIGHTGERHGLSLNADEYSVFNQCIDAGVATSIENFWNGEKAQRQQEMNERFGHLAHELRRALGNAALAFKLLRAGDLELRGRTAAVLSNNLVRMETLVTRTLGTLQLDSGVPLELRPIRVALVLRQLQASAIPERAISVTLEVDESLHVEADEMLLTSAISNLLHNAIELSRSGAQIGLSCRAEPEGVVIEVEVEVEDDCGGSTDAATAELAGPAIVRGDGASKVGLGLSITQRATVAMGGALSLENHPDHSCSFKLTFPLARPSRFPPPLLDGDAFSR